MDLFGNNQPFQARQKKPTTYFYLEEGMMTGANVPSFQAFRRSATRDDTLHMVSSCGRISFPFTFTIAMPTHLYCDVSTLDGSNVTKDTFPLCISHGSMITHEHNCSPHNLSTLSNAKRQLDAGSPYFSVIDFS
jgi:hypothetical protein